MQSTNETHTPPMRRALRFRAGSEEIVKVLDVLAERGLRSRPAQVEWLIREEAIRQGLLPQSQQEAQA